LVKNYFFFFWKTCYTCKTCYNGNKWILGRLLYDFESFLTKSFFWTWLKLKEN